MNLLELLKQFKNIEPDPAFKETSKRAILAQEPMAPAVHGWNTQRTLWRIIEVGAAVALTGFFVLLITGAFSGAGIAPQYSAIDPQSLRAEAQAIDIQIQLANLNYNEAAESTMQIAGAKPAGNSNGKTTSPAPAAPAQSAGSAAATSTASSTVSIDQALQSLSQ